ncbi:tRNA (guanine(46)-N(7))-methyltransferase TrmB [Modicisalibacter luteus]|uniref:tRNA (guanine(46)-N(7))-methyltransferase n=1 Tax=Modicisalibacter luteus TaxID=453962 RepID=A0ABV7M7F8_9GAMM|nr:hypothetical protein [Halomonas lutea]GHA98638.1 SAM-dependent methyltransferase [Halomonas lutea]
MQSNSRSITTNQHGPHDELSRRVERGLTHPLRKPVAEHTRQAFAHAEAWLKLHRAPLILDAGCGVGLSTRRLALEHPDHAVIGVDRSADRLAREHGEPPGNSLLVRADLVDFWRLALAAGWKPRKHYLLYPNPYPKAAHLKMRWHGHPVFPAIVALGGRLEVRSNWRLYLEEFALAVGQASGQRPEVIEHHPAGECLTPFEAKYLSSDQALWKLVTDLPHRPELLPGLNDIR